MAALALLLVLGCLAAAAAFGRPAVALAVLVGTVTLIPGSLPVPGLPGVFTVHRTVLLAALVGLLWRCARGDLSWELLRPPPLAYRFALALGVIAIVGVGLLQPSTDPAQASRSWQALVAQLLVLFTVVALTRADGRPGVALTALAVAVALSALIAIGEHVTGSSYARVWYHAVPALLGSDPAGGLTTRNGQLRVRASADFALAFSWTTAALVPVLIVAAAAARGLLRRALLVAVPVVLLAVVWSFSRSVMVPLLVAVLLVLVAVRDRSVQRAVGAVLLLAAVVAVARPSLLSNFTAAADQGSIDVRVDRLPAVTALASAHPFRGLGISGLSALGFPATDSTFLLAYAEIGAIGVAALVAAVLAGCVAASGGLFTRDADLRAVAAAAGGGAVLLLVGAISFDVFTTPTSAETFWILVALGVVAAEGRPSRAHKAPLSLTVRVAALVALAGIGLVLRVTAPEHVGQTWSFDTLTASVATRSAPDFTGRQLRNTFCQLAKAEVATVKHTAITCGSLDAGPGQGSLRLQAGSQRALVALRAQVMTVIHRVPSLSDVQLRRVEPARRGTPSLLRTAPAWLPVLGLILLVPTPRRRTPSEPVLPEGGEPGLRGDRRRVPALQG